MATQFFRFLGKGLGFYVSDVSGGESCGEQKGGESCGEQKRGESPVQARLNEEVLIEQLFSSVPKDLGVTRADVKVRSHVRLRTLVVFATTHTTMFLMYYYIPTFTRCTKKTCRKRCQVLVTIFLRPLLP